MYSSQQYSHFTNPTGSAYRYQMQTLFLQNGSKTGPKLTLFSGAQGAAAIINKNWRAIFGEILSSDIPIEKFINIDPLRIKSSKVPALFIDIPPHENMFPDELRMLVMDLLTKFRATCRESACREISDNAKKVIEYIKSKFKNIIENNYLGQKVTFENVLKDTEIALDENIVEEVTWWFGINLKKSPVELEKTLMVFNKHKDYGNKPTDLYFVIQTTEYSSFSGGWGGNINFPKKNTFN